MSNEQWSEWIEWNGGGCPLPEGTVCDVRHRDGDYGTRVHAGLNSCEDDSTGSALAEDWGHTGYGGDIIAYRYRLDDNTMTEEEQEIPAEEWKGKVGGSWNHGEDTELLRVARERMDDESVPLTIKQLRYLDAKGEDWVDEFARTATVDEFRGAMRFTIGKYLRRAGKKDDLASEIEKMRDYCERWIAYERSL